jgi:ketol-acid reductoisomerase
MAIIDFGGEKEKVVTRKEFTLAKARRALKNEIVAVIGYGVQGPAQALNMRDNGVEVIVGQSPRFEKDWDRARKDGWKPRKTLFDIPEAVKRGTIIQMLVSDAAQPAIWPVVKENLDPGDALYFSHGFSIAYKDQTRRPRAPAPRSGGTSSRAPGSTRATPSSRTPPAARRSAASPWASR